MKRVIPALVITGFLSACSGDGTNPFDNDEEDGTTGGVTTPTEELGPIDSNGTPLPGTLNPSSSSAIVRYEPQDSETGGGYARDVSYDAATDEFTVDNLAFDGDNAYARSTRIPGLGPFAVYEADQTTTDPVTGNVIDTFAYRAIYGRSTSGASEFAIVRTGSYSSYGFGGFVYQRNSLDDNGNSVQLVLPEDGDAEYEGAYAGTRVFDGRGGQQFTTGNASMLIDFKDFNDGNRGVAIFVRDRRLFDSDGNDITDDYLAALDSDAGEGVTPIYERDAAGNPVLPSILPIVNPDNANSNGEIAGDVFTRISYTQTDDQGNTTITSDTLSEGRYYAIMSGDQAEEIVGVVVIEGGEAGTEANFQETGGFIVYRK